MSLRIFLLLGLILAAAAMRLLPHPPNVTPITAIALLGGACFPRWWQGFAVCVAVMLLSDLVLGFHSGMIFVYAAFAITVAMGLMLRRRRRPIAIAGMSLAASLQFFIITNFGSWLAGHMYPRTLAGLGESYAAGILFFRNAVLGDLVFSLALFGLYALAQRSLIAPTPIPAPADARV